MLSFQDTYSERYACIEAATYACQRMRGYIDPQNGDRRIRVRLEDEREQRNARSK